MSKNFGVLFSDEFRVDPDWLKHKKIFNPTLDVDSPLFVDPFLLAGSVHPEFSEGAFASYEQHFHTICTLLLGSEAEGDKLWKAALERFLFREAKGLSGTCLGYSKHSTKGHAFGPVLSQRALQWAANVIRLGVKDPELFSMMSLFEGGIGADLISDMTTNIALKHIIAFNNRVVSAAQSDLGVKLTPEKIVIGTHEAKMLINPYSQQRTPVILLAADVLKHLPLFDDPKRVAEAAEQNKELRSRVNTHISEIFKIRTKAEKDRIKQQAMQSGPAFQAFLDALKLSETTPYDLSSDPDGLLQWSPIAQQFATFYKCKIEDNRKATRLERLQNISTTIIKQFQVLVEDNRMSRVFHVRDKPRHERFAQLLFLAIAKIYCKANDVGVSPEADAGAGPVDFKFSDGADSVLVEIKLSTNSQCVHGYKKQLDAYLKAEDTTHGHFVFIDVGKGYSKWKQLQDIAKRNPEYAKTRKLHRIDGHLRPSASHL